MNLTRRQTIAGALGTAAALSLPGRLPPDRPVAARLLGRRYGGHLDPFLCHALSGKNPAPPCAWSRCPTRGPVSRAGRAPQYHTGIGTFVQGVNLMRDDMLETFSIDELPAMKDIDEKYWLKTPDGRLAGVTPYFAYYGIAVNTNEASVDDFQSWKDLANEKWRGRLGMTRPIYLSTYDLTMFSIAAGGDEMNTAGGMELLTGMARNVLIVSNSLAQQNTMLERGEVAAMPFYSTRVWALNEAGVDYVKMVIPTERQPVVALCGLCAQGCGGP